MGFETWAFLILRPNYCTSLVSCLADQPVMISFTVFQVLDFPFTYHFLSYSSYLKPDFLKCSIPAEALSSQTISLGEFAFTCAKLISK